MGWLAGVLHRIAADVAGAPPIDFTFVPSITAPVISGVGEPIEPDSCYIELYLESLRLEQARRFATRSTESRIPSCRCLVRVSHVRSLRPFQNQRDSRNSTTTHLIA